MGKIQMHTESSGVKILESLYLWDKEEYAGKLEDGKEKLWALAVSGVKRDEGTGCDISGFEFSKLTVTRLVEQFPVN
jgi:hypothetical protein